MKSTRGTASALVRAGAALLACAALFGGLPYVLVRFVGWPLPRSLPSGEELRDALVGSTISDDVIVKGVALVCWVALVHLGWCVAVEAAAWVSGRQAPPVAFGRALQPLARELVLSVTMIFGLARAAFPQPATLPAPVLAVAPEPDTAGAVVGAAVLTPSEADAPATKSRVVKPRETLWGLAEAHLGDPFRWRELWELNRGRTFPDGRTFHDPNLVHPGWSLLFPADAVGIVADEAPSPVSATPSVEPQAMDDAPAPPSSTPAPAAPVRDAGPRADEDSAVADAAIALQVSGGAIVAAGVVTAIVRRRRTQQRRRERGRAIPMPSGSVQESEAQLRDAAAGAPGAPLDLALRLLGRQLRLGSDEVPAVEMVSADHERVEILFVSPPDAQTGPFEAVGDGRCWLIALDVLEGALAAEAAEQPSPLPALAVAGVAENREYLVDLEAPGWTQLSGDDREVAAALWTLALDLATSERADDVTVVVAGEPPAGLGTLDRVTVVSDLSAIVERLTAEAGAISKSLAATGCDTTLRARLAVPGEAWTPTIVFAAPDQPAEAVRALASIAGRGLAVVTVGAEPDAPRSISIAADGARAVAPPGLHLDQPPLSHELLRDACDLIDLSAGDRHGDAVDIAEQQPLAREELPLALRLTRRAGSDDEDRATKGGLVVRVLGPVEFDGAEQTPDRPKSREVVVFLALHPKGVDESRLKAAIWPRQAPTLGAFNQTVSKARNSLGRDPAGEPHVSLVTDGTYRLASTATSDLALLESAYRRARLDPSNDNANALAGAIDAIRGLPFEGTRGHQWAYAEGFASHAESVAADAAGFLAEWCLERGDAETAVWATRQGVLASPAYEPLYRLRMRALAQLGDTAAVEATMDELCAVLETSHPDEDVDPETLGLYRDLTKSRAFR